MLTLLIPLILEALKAGESILALLNDPRIVAEREKAEAQVQSDKDAQAALAASQGDPTELRERSS